MTSIELSQYVGGLLAEEFPHVRVDVRHPEYTVNLEVRDYAAYVHGPSEAGAGGMPVGANGRVVSLLSGGIDSPVSTYMVARRGVKVIPVHFFSFPYTSMQAKEKVVELTRILTRYCGRLTLEVVPFTRIQEEIRTKCPEELFTIIMRRFMMRLSERVAEANGCGALAREKPRQVASQTLEGNGRHRGMRRLPVCRHVWARQAGDRRDGRENRSFDTSVLPYEDCCTVFTPRAAQNEAAPWRRSVRGVKPRRSGACGRSV
jgi:thiamine biosynthesis protein ThiI